MGEEGGRVQDEAGSTLTALGVVGGGGELGVEGDESVQSGRDVARLSLLSFSYLPLFSYSQLGGRGLENGKTLYSFSASKGVRKDCLRGERKRRE